MAKSRNKTRSQRQLRVGEELRHVLAKLFERESFHHPSLQNANVTVTEVQVSPDLRSATVFVMLFGSGEINEVLRGLNQVKSFLRRRAAEQLTLRSIPTLIFANDAKLETAAHIDTLLSRPEVVRDLAEDNSGDTDIGA